mmetsp:Transcript_26376/g.40479  ORF Transcript_26376/g.40479 Transcript_26376/m.40479 type:complete len:273 (+) Transcript_26376:35-853(+)
MLLSNKTCLFVLASCILLSSGNAFITPRPSGVSVQHQWGTTTTTTVLEAKKKKGNRGGKGFGKAPEPEPVNPATAASGNEFRSSKDTTAMDPRMNSGAGSGTLQSVSGGSNATPTMSSNNSDMPAEERTKQILREQYGLKTLEEQETDRKKREAMKEARKKQEAWQKQLEAENFDIMQAIPAPILIGIDRFLKLGVTVSTVVFVAAGVAITAEAYAAATNNPLPEDIDNFIVTVVEPNFTPGLLVLLGFSVSLGIFASAQLGSSGSQYSEDN